MNNTNNNNRVKLNKQKFIKGSFVVIPNKEQLRGEDAYTQCVFKWLCDYCNEKTGTCFPSLKKLAKDVGSTKNTVQKRIDRLVELGLIEKENRVRDDGSKTSNLYHIYQVMRIKSDRGMSSNDQGVSQEMGDMNNNHSNNNQLNTKTSKSDSRSEDQYDGEYELESEDDMYDQFGNKKKKKNKLADVSESDKTNAAIERIWSRWEAMCVKELGTKPKKTRAAKIRIRKALNSGGLTEDQVYDLFEEWIIQEKPETDLIHITYALSDHFIDEFKALHGLSE